MAHHQAESGELNGSATAVALSDREQLRPYVPRLLLQWTAHARSERVSELDGSLLSLDITGFTMLSEKLAAKGKRGAEEVSHLINSCFTRFLDVAYADDGALLKFGGDALLLLFGGDEHAARACRAALRMRTELAAIELSEAASLGVALGMTVGINSGRFLCFCVGGSHRELIITGPAADLTASVEGAAANGEIVVSLATAAMLDEAALGDERGPGRLLVAEPQGMPPPGPTPIGTATDPAVFVPVGLRAQLAAGHLEGEHRQATVGFIDFSGVDELLAAGGVDAVADALDSMMRIIQVAIDAEGVCFQNSDLVPGGGNILLTAGVPQASERDDERMLRAVRRMADSEFALRLRFGVNRGRVFCGVIGTPIRRTYAVTGDAVNVAARLCGKAAPGEIVAAVNVIDRSQTIFDTEEMEPLRLKGKAQPVSAVRLGAPTGARRAGEVRLPLVGRDRELHELRSGLLAAVDGRGRAVELVGDPGMGKSRLLEEMALLCTELSSAGTEVTRISVGCEPYEASTAYFPVRLLLRSLLGIDSEVDAKAMGEALRLRLEAIAPELLPWMPLFAIPLDAEVDPTPETDRLDPSFRRLRMHDVVLQLLGLVLPGPAFVVIEDVHWIDEASTELLRYVATQIRSHPWLLCVTVRPDARGLVLPPEVSATHIELHPLPPEASASLAMAATEEWMVAPHEAETLVERAGGNPLFLSALLHGAKGRAAGDAIPETVEAVLATRIDSLTPRDRRILRYASGIGPTFSEGLLFACAGEDPSSDPGIWERLTEFVYHDARTGTHGFRHALVHQVAYEGLAYERRRELHATVGHVYEERAGEKADELAGTLSLHFSRAEVYDKAWHYSLVAADAARAKYATVEAAELYARALESAGRLEELGAVTPSEVAAVWESLGDVAELGARYDQAADAFRNALDRAADRTSHPRVLHKSGRVRNRLGQFAESLLWYELGLADCEDVGPSADRMRLSLGMAWSCKELGNFVAAIKWGESALADAEILGDKTGQGEAYYLLHTVHCFMGTPERQRYRELALPIIEALGDLVHLGNVLNNIGIQSYYEGRWDEALDFYRRGMEARQQAGDVVGAALGLNNIGELQSDQGHLNAARSAFQSCQATAIATGSRYVENFALGNLGRVAARAGEFDRAEELLGAALQGHEESKAEALVVETQARLAELATLRGDHGTALELVDPTLARVAAIGGMAVIEVMLHRIAGYALAQSGDLSAARQRLELSLAIGREAGADYEVALTLCAAAAVARLAGDPQATALEEEGRRTLDALGVVMTADPPLPDGPLAGIEAVGRSITGTQSTTR